jgi:CheY-like chemotaxis protein
MQANPITQSVLLVDDEPVSRKAQQARLEGEGYTVFVAQNQAEALSRAKVGAPKVIYLHLVTGSDGNLPLIQALRSDDSCRHIPIVVIKDHVDARVVPTKLRSVGRERW